MSFYTSNLGSLYGESLTDKCIVLDLDECLLHSIEKPFIEDLKIYSNPNLIDLRSRVYKLPIRDYGKARGTGTLQYIEGIRRPHLNEFLSFCFSYFKIVAVWSAGKREYVESAVNTIFSDVKYPHIVYSFDDLKIENGDYDKPLQKMIDEVNGLAKYMSLDNTYILDDRPSNFNSNPSNGITIPKYNPQPNISQLRADDPAFIQLTRWLIEPQNIQTSDVRTLNKSNIFTKPIDQYQPVNIALVPINQTIKTPV